MTPQEERVFNELVKRVWYLDRTLETVINQLRKSDSLIVRIAYAFRPVQYPKYEPLPVQDIPGYDRIIPEPVESDETIPVPHIHKKAAE